MLRSGAEHRRADLKRQIGLGSEAVVEALDRKELGPGRAVRVADDVAVPQLRVVHARCSPDGRNKLDCLASWLDLVHNWAARLEAAFAWLREALMPGRPAV